jgi:RimJ/RimL family protein N-acetyltransferase
MLRGEHVILRPIEPEHLPNYVRWLADPDVLAYFGPYRPMNLAQERDWYEDQNKSANTVNFACEYQGQHIGGGGFCNLSHQHQSAEVGLFIGEKTLWDRGLGRDMLRSLLAYGFDQLNLHRIYLRVFAENVRAVHAYEQVGFAHEGRWRQAEWRHGRWHDLLFMSILREEWSRTG